MKLKLLFLPLLLLNTAQLASAAPSSFAYDLNNRVTQVNHADGRQATFTYDEVGNILSIVTRNAAPPSIVVSQPLLLTVGSAMPDYAITLTRPAVIKSYAIKGLPAGLKSNLTIKVNADGRNPGVIYGTPTTAGVYRVELSATTSLGANAPVTLMIHVSNSFGLIEDGFGLAGQFSGILPDSAINGGLGGSWVLKTTSTGGFTGTLTVGALKYSFAGSFNGLTGIAPAITILRKTPFTTNLTINLALDLATTSTNRGRITGTLGDGIVTDTISAFREVWSKTLPAAFFADALGSTYNTAFFLDTAHATDVDYPQGVSYARITADRLGKASIAGKLADGTTVTASTIFWPDGQVPLFVPLYTGKGSLTGTLMFGTGFAEDLVTDNDVTGSLLWTRPSATTGIVYKKGFSTQVDSTGGVYVAPLKGARVLDLGTLATHDSIHLNLTSGGLVTSINPALTVSTANLVTAITPNANTIKLTFTPLTGFFSGEFAVGTRKAKIEGLILPANPLNDSEAYGFFLLPGTTATSATLSGFSFIGRP